MKNLTESDSSFVSSFSRPMREEEGLHKLGIRFNESNRNMVVVGKKE